jgi:hypothetical protein
VLSVSAIGQTAERVNLVKGKSVILDANAENPVWTAEPAGVVRIEPLERGRARITALRDWFDEEPRKEPKAALKACVGAACRSFEIICLIDADGRWSADLVGKWLGIFDHSEHRDLRFVQNGREIAFEPDPGKPAKLRLEGNRVRLTDGGEVLNVFDGSFSDRQNAGGKFASKPGFSGQWKAKRAQ